MINVAVMGYGTVGSGVVEVLAEHENAIARKISDRIRVKYILNRKELPTHLADRLVRDFSVIERDPEVSIVIETMGGIDAALDYTRRALAAGKSVVTSNKEVVAAHGYELTRLAAENGVCYLFEASVGGGIPIIRPLSQCLAANDILELRGILNGTTNYILTRMIRAGLSFEDALAEAQQKGYAERNPSADILGYDACRKICILSDIAFGRHIYPEQVPTEGITGIALADVDYAASAGKKIKLLGRAIRQADGRICICVGPHLVDASDPLSGVEDVFNAISVRGDAVGDVMFYGRGAGKLPTASAVVADVIDIAAHQGHRKVVSWEAGGSDVVCGIERLESCWYVRAVASESTLQSALGKVKILTKAHEAEGEAACLTDRPMSREELDQRIAGLDVRSVIRVLD